LLVNGLKDLGHSKLYQLVLCGWDPKRPKFPIKFGNVTPSDQLGPIPRALQTLDKVADVGLQILPVMPIIHFVHSGCGILSQEMPAPVEMLLIEQTVEVAEPMPLISLCPFRYSLQ
jgi:hypothetical protein